MVRPHLNVNVNKPGGCQVTFVSWNVKSFLNLFFPEFIFYFFLSHYYFSFSKLTCGSFCVFCKLLFIILNMMYIFVHLLWCKGRGCVLESVGRYLTVSSNCILYNLKMKKKKVFLWLFNRHLLQRHPEASLPQSYEVLATGGWLAPG